MRDKIIRSCIWCVIAAIDIGGGLAMIYGVLEALLR